MGKVTGIVAALQGLLGVLADSAAEESGVIQRVRKFTARTLARTMICGFLQNPRATDEQLAQVAAQCGVEITVQGMAERFTPRLQQFLEALARRAMLCVVASDHTMAPLLERFTEVRVLDSSVISLPDSQQEQFRGCGGSYNSGASALKLQVEMDLRSGALRHIEPEAGRSPDNASSRQQASLPAGSLRIADLGYFDTEVFERFSRENVFWLSRLQFGTQVFHGDGSELPLLTWLAEQPGPVVDVPILLSLSRKVPCRLVAWRVPPEMANRRRQKLREECLRKRGREPTQERLAWCDWMLLVTNVSEEKLSPTEMVVLYRARWQIELLFKRWKSQGLLSELQGSTDTRQMIRMWSRLLAALVQHWLVISSLWGDPRHSLSKACEAVRPLVSLLLASLNQSEQLQTAIDTLCRTLRATARQNKRKNPSTFQLLNDPSQLTWSLT